MSKTAVDNNAVHEELLDLAGQTATYLRYLQGLGLANLPRVDIEPIPEQDSSPLTETLEDIQADLGDCERCSLAQGRSNIVFGQGNPSARVMFIGGVPSVDEDREGALLLGETGGLLTNIIVKGMQMKPDDFYFTNIVKCRPEGGQKLEDEHVQACRSFLLRQINTVHPDIICTLGPVAVQKLLDTDNSLAVLRNSFHDLAGVKVMPTFHPDHLLAYPKDKAGTWADIKLILAKLEEIGSSDGAGK